MTNRVLLPIAFLLIAIPYLSVAKGDCDPVKFMDTTSAQSDTWTRVNYESDIHSTQESGTSANIDYLGESSLTGDTQSNYFKFADVAFPIYLSATRRNEDSHDILGTFHAAMTAPGGTVRRKAPMTFSCGFRTSTRSSCRSGRTRNRGNGK